MPSAALHPDRCWFEGKGPCDGRLVRAHLIPRQRIARELFTRFREQDMTRPDAAQKAFDLAWSDDVWVPMCGGPTGVGGHHGLFDSRRISIARAALPEKVERFAETWSLEWSLTADFGPRAKEKAA